MRHWCSMTTWICDWQQATLLLAAVTLLLYRHCHSLVVGFWDVLDVLAVHCRGSTCGRWMYCKKKWMSWWRHWVTWINLVDDLDCRPYQRCTTFIAPTRCLAEIARGSLRNSEDQHSHQLDSKDLSYWWLNQMFLLKSHRSWVNSSFVAQLLFVGSIPIVVACSRHLQKTCACSFILNWVNSLNEPQRYRNGLLQQCIIYPHRSEIRRPQQSFVGFWYWSATLPSLPVKSHASCCLNMLAHGKHFSSGFLL